MTADEVQGHQTLAASRLRVRHRRRRIGLPAPIGEWNYEEVVVKRPPHPGFLNGTLITDADLGKTKSPWMITTIRA